jgi:hypothetical protein
LARILIVGGGERGRLLAGKMVGAGHAVRLVSSDPSEQDEIEAIGAEYWVGTPARLGTLRGALDGVAIACWLLGCGEGGLALHGERLELFMTQVIDTTVRGVIYEAAGTVPADVLAGGARLVATLAQKNMIPVAILTADPAEAAAWLAQAQAAIAALLDGATNALPDQGEQGVDR